MRLNVTGTVLTDVCYFVLFVWQQGKKNVLAIISTRWGKAHVDEIFESDNRLFRLADRRRRHMSPTPKSVGQSQKTCRRRKKTSATFVGDIWPNCRPTVDQSLQASRSSATPTRQFYWRIRENSACKVIEQFCGTSKVVSSAYLRMVLKDEIGLRSMI